MCGVFGYIGEKEALTVCLEGLEKLEYRGYDSTGIAGIHEGVLSFYKKAGKLKLFKQEINLPKLEIAIAHTRWATHGKVSDENAHPHFDSLKNFALVHNGIIENFDSLKENLLKEGIAFQSETDTEVIAHLIQKHYRGDLVKALYEVLPQIKGVFAFVCIHKDHPDQIVAAARDCPLSIAFDDAKTESIISSDPNAFIGSALNVLFLRKDEIAKVKKGVVEIYGHNLAPALKKPERFEADSAPPSKEGFAHYLLKEIVEQPLSIQRGYLGRFDTDLYFEELNLSPEYLEKVDQVWVLGCGTSYHAGIIGSLYFEELAKVPSFAEIASEARYRTPLLPKNTLALAISQSGETADTLAAAKEASKNGSKILGLCNVKNSTMARESDATVFLKAGPEISVCSTKTFTSHLTLLFLLSLYLGKVKKSLSPEKIAFYVQELKKIPKQVQSIIDQREKIQKIAQKYAQFEDFFFMGRRYMYPTCLESALKLKEISYANANGYPGGELKHGAIALLNPQFPVVAFTANRKTQEKIVSNLMEVKARGAPLLAFAPEDMKSVAGIADDTFWLPPTIDELSPFASTVAGQLFAYYVALEKGCDIDQPRNLAKSVTVE